MADLLDEILGSAGMLFIPSDNVHVSGNLPSPEALRGKVYIKGKRPKAFVNGASVMNDDFDMYLDDMEYDVLLEDPLDEEDEEEEEKVGVIVGFEATGPVRSTADDAVKKSPVALLGAAMAATENARMEVERAKSKAEELRIDADTAEEEAAELGRVAGLSPAEIKARATGDVDDEGTQVDLSKFENSMPSESVAIERGIPKTTPEEGLEVQDFFEGSVEDARAEYAAKDAELLEAVDLAATASIRLQEAEEGLQKAQLDLAASYEREKELEESSRRAANEARSNREHADTARQRVETVRDMLRNWKDNANSAETVVHTAMTEAKISDQRAAETEARAERALAAAEKDRTRAEIETQKEEQLEHEVAILHEKSVMASTSARSARERMEKAATMLDKVNEQIKLIENSTHYQKEMNEGDREHVADDVSESSARYVSKFSAKHAAKLSKREELTKALIAATKENAEAETHRRSAHELFEEKARMWKVQAEVSTRARKQADRSSAIYEELAEHAEEEREAAQLRQVAHEKAAKNVTQSDSYRASVQAQLMEAERASAEAANMAVESRNRAERLAKEAAESKDHSIAFSTLEARKLRQQDALREYEKAMEVKAEAEARAEEAKRLLDTSSEVLSSAKREAAAEIHRANAERQAEKSAISAYNKAVLSRKQAMHASSLATLAETTLDEKKAALAHAQKYKERYDKVAPVSLGLASMALLDSHRFKSWEKSLALSCTQMHSFPQGLVLHMLNTDTYVNGMLQFTRSHMLRSFPSWKLTDSATYLNCNPVSQWAVGCQLVSMDFQVSDEHLLVNDGRFRVNGSTGYVLKPQYLLKDGHPSEKWQHWKLQILSGRCLPKPRGHKGLPVGIVSAGHVNPYVRVYLYDGVTGKNTAKLLHSTEPVDRNGLNPVWDTAKEFEVAVERPSIAILLFAVWDKRSDGTSDFIAGAAVPVSCMREGYRSVSLYDSLHTKLGPFSFASLFVRAQKIS
jgi:phosphatidylinositol phospholipase C delta